MPVRCWKCSRPAPSDRPWVISAPVATSSLYPAAFDHLAEQQSLFRDGHRAGYRDDPEAIAVADHLLEHVCGLSEAATSEGGLGHRAHEGVDTGGLIGVEGCERCQPVVVTGSVFAFVARVSHCTIPPEPIGAWP